ncbi:MAG: hypothetical protein JWO63_1220 [Frankiales bacterium]|nr:hypothetical protein [Frankiales bacterium]
MTASTPVAAIAPAANDRQQAFRDRIAEVEEQAQGAQAEVDAASEQSLVTADKLEKARRALQTAERNHAIALADLGSAEARVAEMQGELGSLHRRLEMASAVRKARA